MKNLLTGFLFLVLISGLSAESLTAQDRGGGFGIGVILGEPTGITPKVQLSNSTALAGGVAWAFGGKTTFHLHLDYQIHNYNLAQAERGTLSFYYGLGARILLRDDPRVGARFPLGINYLFDSAPVEIFLEIAPIFDLVPSTEFNGNGGIGVRFFL